MRARSSTAAQRCSSSSSSGPHGSVPVILISLSVQHKGQPGQQRCEISLTQEEWLTVVTQHTFKAHLLVLLCPLTPKTLFEWTLPSTNLWGFVTPLYNREDGLTCCQWVNHGGSAAPARRCRSRNVLSAPRGQVGRRGESLRQGQLPPWEAGQEGELFLSGLRCSKVSAQARWAEGSWRTPLPQREYVGSLSDPPPFSFFTSLCTLSLPLSENWICCGPHHLFQGNSSYSGKQAPHLSLLPVSRSFNSLL